MIKIENKIIFKKGFTLIELLIVIAIIGILAGVVMVSSSGGVEKSKKASAITTMSSILPELVTCQDDIGFGIGTAAPTGGTTFICCTTNACTAAQAGHNVVWPNILTKTGYAYGIPTGTLALGTYAFTATKSGQPTIICDYAKNSCD